QASDLLAQAQAAGKEAEELFATWAATKKELEKIAQETKEKVSAAIDRLLKKLEEEVMKTAEKVLEKALETATRSWDLKEAESATGAEATKQLKQAMQDSLAAAKEELTKLGEAFE